VANVIQALDVTRPIVSGPTASPCRSDVASEITFPLPSCVILTLDASPGVFPAPPRDRPPVADADVLASWLLAEMA
jgi:hypothetical protein